MRKLNAKNYQRHSKRSAFGVSDDMMIARNNAISHERFLKLSAEYETEQAELQKQIRVFEEETNTFDRQQIDFKQFYEIVKNMSALKN